MNIVPRISKFRDTTEPETVPIYSVLISSTKTLGHESTSLLVYRTTTNPLSKSASTCVCVTSDSSLTSFSSLRSYDFSILRLL